MLVASLIAIVFVNDVFTSYVFLEINMLASCALVVKKENKKTIKACIKYTCMSIIGSSLFFLGTILLYGITGHLHMEYIHAAIEKLAANGQYHMPLLVSLGLFGLSLSMKGALFPFHVWLPDTYGHSTTSVSALLSSVVVKSYIVLLIKILVRVYGIDTLQNLGIGSPFLVMGLISMILGSILAFTQKDLKRRWRVRRFPRWATYSWGLALSRQAVSLRPASMSLPMVLPRACCS